MWVFSGLHGQGTSLSPGPRGTPTEWKQGTKSPSSPSASSAGLPILVMMRMLTTDVGRVRDLDPEVRDVGSQRAHAEGDHVHRAPLHAACRELPQLLVELPGIDPVVGRPRIATAARSDERAVLDPRHVFRVRTAEIAVRPLLRVEGNERACVHHLLAEAIALLFRGRHTIARRPAGRAAASPPPTEAVARAVSGLLVHPFQSPSSRAQNRG